MSRERVVRPLFAGGVFLIVLLAACGTDSTRPSTVVVDPVEVTGLPPSGEKSETIIGRDPGDTQNRDVYIAAADTAVDLIQGSALALSRIGLDISGTVVIPVDTRSVVSAAADTLRLALDAMREIPVPEGLGPLKESIITSATFYLRSAEVILGHGDDRPFDFFDFQEPFGNGGHNFHEASGLLTEANTAR